MVPSKVGSENGPSRPLPMGVEVCDINCMISVFAGFEETRDRTRRMILEIAWFLPTAFVSATAWIMPSRGFCHRVISAIVTRR